MSLSEVGCPHSIPIGLFRSLSFPSRWLSAKVYSSAFNTFACPSFMVKRGNPRRPNGRTRERRKLVDTDRVQIRNEPLNDSQNERTADEMHDSTSDPSPQQTGKSDAIATLEDMQKKAGEDPSRYSDIIFQCVNCHVVVGDTCSPHIVDLDHNILSLKTASNIQIEDKLHVCQNGFAAGCTFKRILCGSCNAPVGKTYTSTTAALDQYRSLYTLDYDSLDTYRLGSGKTQTGETLDDLDLQHANMRPDGEEPRVSAEDFIALDTYVTDVGKAVNKQTDAMDQYGKALEELQKDFKDSDNLMKDVRQSLEYVQNIMLVWDERLRNIDTQKEKTNKLLELYQGCTERYQSMELQITKVVQKSERLKDAVVRLDQMERTMTKLNAKVGGIGDAHTHSNNNDTMLNDKIKGTFAPIPRSLSKSARNRHQSSGRLSPKAKRRRS